MISFIICAYNEEKNLKDTVQSIYDAIKNIKFNYEYEIIIVDDGTKIVD
jgi:glycosyltransferase involved in cell wall biosynthesis